MMSNVGLEMEYTSVYQIYIKCFWEKWWLTIQIVFFPSYQVEVPNPRWQYKEPRFWGILFWDLYPGSFNENRFKLTFHLDPWKQCPINPNDLYDTKQQTWGYNWDSSKMMVKRLTLFGCKAQWCICNLALDENDISSREASTCTAKQESSAHCREKGDGSVVSRVLSRVHCREKCERGDDSGVSWRSISLGREELSMFLKFRSWKAAETPSHPAHLSDGKRWNSKGRVVCQHILSLSWIGIDLDLKFNRPPLQMAACPIVDTLPAVHWFRDSPDPSGYWSRWFLSMGGGQPKHFWRILGPFPSGGRYIIPYCFKMYIWIIYIYIHYTSSTAQGGGGSFKNRKPIGEIGCCESGMAERSHWWTERWLRSPLFLSLSLTIYLPTYLWMYLSIGLSLSFI